jgi:methylphosphotriester-DNA--protein-cysteine methyltransferase
MIPARRTFLLPLVFLTPAMAADSRIMNPLSLTSIFLVSFSAGFLIFAGIATLVRGGKRIRKNIKDPEQNKTEKDLVATIINAIDLEITNKELTRESISGQTGVPAKTVNSLLKQHFNMTFENYLLNARTEIAKERIRSSRASEKDIAQLCGFCDVQELVRGFKKFSHMTPKKFREAYQVT